MLEPKPKPYGYYSSHGLRGSFWHIAKLDKYGQIPFKGKPVFSLPYLEEHEGLGQPPEEFRIKFEGLLAEAGWAVDDAEPILNLVEAVQEDDADCAWDQPCLYGHRVERHAVYCHNKRWLYAPTKCHRHRVAPDYEKPWPHEECPGFAPNLIFEDEECLR